MAVQVINLAARKIERKLLKTGDIEWVDFLAGDSDAIMKHLLFRASVNPDLKRRLKHVELMDKFLLSDEVLHG
jgi:hypothetical protein